MHKRIAHLAAIALLFACGAGADDLGLSGPGTVQLGSSAEYRLSFKLSGPVAARTPKYAARNAAGEWTNGTAAMTTTSNGDGTRTVVVKKTVGFPTAGSWLVKLSAELWTTPPCRKQPCPGPVHSGSRYGTKDVSVIYSGPF